MSGLRGGPLIGGVSSNYQLPIGPTPGFGGPGLERLSIEDPGVRNGIILGGLQRTNPNLAFQVMGGGLSALGQFAGARPVAPAPRPPVVSVGERGIPGGGAPGNITQNTSYSQPYTVNNNTNVQAPLVPMTPAAMQPEPLQRNEPMGMIPISPLRGLAQDNFIAAGGQAMPPAVAQAVQQAAQPHPGAASIEARDAGQGMGAQGPLLQRSQGPQQPGPAPQQVAAAPQQPAPPAMAAPAAPAPQPGGEPPVLKGEEDYAQPSLSDRTAQMQGAPPRDELTELKQKILEMQAALESQAAANQQQAPTQIPHIMKKPNPALMMMSPKLTTMFLQSRQAEYKAQAEAAQKADQQRYEMAKQREHDEYDRETEKQKIELKDKLDKHLTAGQEAEQRSKFWKLPPGSDERWDIAHSIPDLRNKIDMPQDTQAASEYKIKAHEATIKAHQAAIAQEKQQYVQDDAFNESQKLKGDVEGQDLVNQFNRATYGDRVNKQFNETERSAQEVSHHALADGLAIQSAALDAVAKVQSIKNHQSDEYYKAFDAATKHYNSLINARSYLPNGHPSIPFVDAAIMAMDTALGSGVTQEYKTKSGKTKTRTTVEGDNTLAGGLMNQARTKTLQGGLQYQVQPQSHPQQATPAAYKNNGLVPPPPVIAPNIITPGGQMPFDLEAMVQRSAAQFGPNRLAQAPPPVQIQSGQPQGPVGQPLQMPDAQALPPQPGGYNPAFGQPRQEPAPPMVQAKQPPGQPAPHPGAVKTDVERSLEAGQWVGAQPPTTAEQLQLIPAVLGGALQEVVTKAVPEMVRSFNDKSWQSEKKQVLNPFVTPESRQLPRGSELTDPELTRYFAIKSHTDQQKYEDLVKSAGWAPVKVPNGKPQPITDDKIAQQAWSHSARDFLLTSEQRDRMQAAQDQRRKDRAFATTQGKAGFQLFKPAAPPAKLAGSKKVAHYQAGD